MVIADMFKENQRMSSYGMQYGYIRTYANLYLDMYKGDSVAIYISIVTTDTMQCREIYNELLDYQIPCTEPLQAVIDTLTSIFSFIRETHDIDLPLRINEKSIYGDVARLMMRGDIIREHLKDNPILTT